MQGGKSPKSEANRLTQLLRAVLGDDRFPVDVAGLAREVSRNNDDPITTIKGFDIDGFEGMLRANRHKPAWQIIYNDQTPYPGRQRFTLAHELAHYLLHRRPLTTAHYRDGELEEDVDFQCLPLQVNKWKAAEQKREEEADTFASYLLMPIDDYRQQVGTMEISRPLLDHVIDRYDVSLTAAVRKWIEFTDKRAAMIVARDGFALWGRATTAAYKSGVFIRSGLEIPANSIAGMGSTGPHAKSEHAVVLPSGVWNFSRGTEPVRELAFFSDRLGFSISILHFDPLPADHAVDDEVELMDTYDKFITNGQS